MDLCIILYTIPRYLPVVIKRPVYKGKEFTFKCIKDASEELEESKELIRYCINNKKRIISHHKREYDIRSISFEEQYKLYNPIIIGIDGEEEEYPNMYVASSLTYLNIRDILQNYNDSFEFDDIEYTVRPLPIYASEDKLACFEKDKKVNKIYSKIKELRNRHSLEYLFKITGPAA